LYIFEMSHERSPATSHADVAATDDDDDDAE
jgi:hypothetical protein